MSKDSRNMEAARQFLLTRRNKIQGEIDTLSGRLKEVDFLLAELQRSITVVEKESRRPVNGEASYTIPEEIQREVLSAFGRKTKMTSKELAETMQVPQGTAGARLSNMKKLGILRHESPYYYIIAKNVQERPAA